jgi:hypothetical protein
MLWQLDMLRHSMYRGYYVLDAFTCKCHGEDEATAKDEVSDRLFAMYKFKPAKRLCLSARTPENMVFRGKVLNGLRKVLFGLENMEEFVLFFSS